MHDHGTEAVKAGEKIIIVGNPNVGKSVIFGLLTGRYADVSNYPGTTVTLTTGSYHMGGVDTLVMDTPGVNTLIPMSEDEMVTRDILINETITQIVQAGIRRLEPLLPEVNISKRAISLMLLAGDESLKPWLKGHVGINDITQIESIRSDIQDKYYEPLGYIINQIRLKRCEQVIADVLSTSLAERSPIMVHLGNWAMHPVWGIPG